MQSMNMNMNIVNMNRQKTISNQPQGEQPIGLRLPGDTRSKHASRRATTRGFSLIELMIAITVTMIIMGSVYGLMAQGQSAFGREPYLADRQQQIRIAMDRMQEDVLSAGGGLGAFFQSFADGLDNVGPQGVRESTEADLGGPNSDFIEIRRTSADCPSIRTETQQPPGPLSGNNVNTVESFPACYPEPGFVFLLYPDGRSKFGWLHDQHSKGNDKANFPGGQQPEGSQIGKAAPTHINCSVWIGDDTDPPSPNGDDCPDAADLVPAPPGNCPDCPPYAIQQAEFIRYQIGTDTDGTIGLFRSTTGGIDENDDPTDPPGPGWQLVGSGIEDLQVEYRTTNSGVNWLNEPPLAAEATPGDIVLEVRITLWARALTPPTLRLAGETRSQGADAGGVTAVRGSLVSIIAPRAVQANLGTLGLWK
jgi:prepilin-type N-terminal cleavage/methylation domain-containing protein